MTINDFINSLDFNENDYFYHITGNGKSINILEDGLLVNGTNILDVDNILFTTATPLYPEDAFDEKALNNLLDAELSSNKLRGTNEMVIIGSPKIMEKDIVEKYNEVIDGVLYKGIVDKTYIMGYFNINHEFTPNEEFIYGNDEFYEEYHYSI